MTRLTLSAQLTQCASTIQSLQTELAEANQINAKHLATIENQQNEIFLLRKRCQAEEDLGKKLTETEEKLKVKTSSYDYIAAEKNRAEAEIEQAHAVLDGVDGAPSRDYDGEYGKRHRNVVTRLAGAFLAIARNGGAA